MRRLFAFVLALGTVTAACGGKSTNPTSPSSPGSTTPSTSGNGPAPGPAAGSATITGAVQGALPSTVAVAGTTVNANVDSSGRFVLANVPSGDVQLQLSGGGANATLPVTGVQPAQSIDLVVAVSGSSASIDSQVRSGGAESELEGRVEALPPATAPLTFKAAGRLVKTDASTKFVDGGAARTFADLQIGMRVHVKGAPSADAIAATIVELQNSQAAIQVELNGIVSSLTGAASGFQFMVNGTLVKGDTATSFFGDGDGPAAFSDLKNGLRVEVKGQQQNGFVSATRIHVEKPDDAPAPTPPPPDTSASISGTLKTIGGASPALTLTVGTTTVHTSSSTTVKRRGDVQTLSSLVVGQELHVIGTRRSDGSIDAREIEIEDDAEGGEFEVQGSMGGLKGACPAISFTVNGFSIATNAATEFDKTACSAFKNGDKVEVKGTKRADGSVLATRLRKED